MRHVCGTPLLSWCNFWDTVKCHRMHRVTAELSKCVFTACLVEPCTGRVGVVRKVFSCVSTSKTCVGNTPAVFL